MAKFRAKGTQKEPDPLRIGRLMVIAAAFTDRTRIVENTVETDSGLWRLGFDNGHTLVMSSEGTYGILTE